MAYALYDKQNTLIILFCGLSLGYLWIYRAATKLNTAPGMVIDPR
jgi:hypothetical protein